MRKKKRRISDFTNFAPEFTEDFTDDTPKDINLRNYLDDGDQHDIALTDLEKELKKKEREEAEKTIEESINNTDDVAQAAQYVKELLWEFGDEIKKKIEIDKNNILYVEIRPPNRPINTLDDLKTGNYIMIGEEFVETLQSIALMFEYQELVNIFEITWTNVTKEEDKIIKRTRKRTKVEKKYIPKMVEKLKDKPNHEVRIHEVRITAGKPVK
jgi:hypothetical protein